MKETRLFNSPQSLECPVCLNEDFQSDQLVYSICCFNKVCDVCDKILTKCPMCRSELSDLRIKFGWNYFDTKNTSKLRLLSGQTTVGNVIKAVRKHFPVIETQLSNRLYIRTNKLSCLYGDTQISKENEYHLCCMRLPHRGFNESSLESWIISLAVSGDKLTKESLTFDEIYNKCSLYAERLYPKKLSKEYLKERLESLIERGYLKYDDSSCLYSYVP